MRGIRTGLPPQIVITLAWSKYTSSSRLTRGPMRWYSPHCRPRRPEPRSGCRGILVPSCLYAGWLPWCEATPSCFVT